MFEGFTAATIDSGEATISKRAMARDGARTWPSDSAIGTGAQPAFTLTDEHLSLIHI